MGTLAVGHILWGAADGVALQHQPHIKNLVDILRGKCFYIYPLIGDLNHQSVGGQLTQGLPHRTAAHMELVGQIYLLQTLAGGELPPPERISEDLVNLTAYGLDWLICHA